MNKKEHLIHHLESDIQETLLTLKAAALESHSSSTGENSKAEGKYDTRGLEASYLAEAQAEQVKLLENQLERLKNLDLPDQPTSIILGTFVLITGESDEIGYLLLPVGAGKHIEYEGQSFTIVTPSSPVGQSILGKEEGDFIDHPVLTDAFVSEIW